VLFLSMVPETLPSKTVGIGLGLLNGSGTLTVVCVTSIYGVLVDVTGNYGASNAFILASNVLMILTYIFLIRESYGKEVETGSLVREGLDLEGGLLVSSHEPHDDVNRGH
jgi:hypothetical protein